MTQERIVDLVIGEPVVIAPVVVGKPVTITATVGTTPVAADSAAVPTLPDLTLLFENGLI